MSSEVVGLPSLPLTNVLKDRVYRSLAERLGLVECSILLGNNITLPISGFTEAVFISLLLFPNLSSSSVQHHSFFT
jgi:hypothetical protein